MQNNKYPLHLYFNAMRRVLLIIIWVAVLVFAYREFSANREQQNYAYNIDYVVNNAIQQHEECRHFGEAKTFIDYDVLRVGENDDWNLEYNIIASWRWYYIDDRENLSSDCSFSSIPIAIEISENESWYVVENYRNETNKLNYLKFVKWNFSLSGYMARQARQRNTNKRINTLTLAEDYFWVNLFEKKHYKCKFCGTAWYYYDTIKNKTWETINLYGIEPVNQEYVVFDPDGTAQTYGTNDSKKFTRYYGNDDSTIIMDNDNSQETVERFIIEGQGSRDISFITEKIEVYQ